MPPRSKLIEHARAALVAEKAAESQPPEAVSVAQDAVREPPPGTFIQEPDGDEYLPEALRREPVFMDGPFERSLAFNRAGLERAGRSANHDVIQWYLDALDAVGLLHTYPSERGTGRKTVIVLTGERKRDRVRMFVAKYITSETMLRYVLDDLRADAKAGRPWVSTHPRSTWPSHEYPSPCDSTPWPSIAGGRVLQVGSSGLGEPKPPRPGMQLVGEYEIRP